MVEGGSGIPKWVLAVLPSRIQAVPEPWQGHLVDYLRRARGDPRGPLAIRVSQEVEDDLGVHPVDPWPVDAVLQGREAATPSPSGTMPEMATAHVRVRSAARATLVVCLQGPPPDASEEVWAQASGIQKYWLGLSQPALRSAECHRTSGWPGVSWSTLSALVLLGRTAGWSCSRTPAPAIVLAQDRSAFKCSLSHVGPPRWCTTRCPLSSGWSSSACTSMCGSCGTPVATSRAVPQGSPRGMGWPAPTCTITHSARSCACSIALAHWSSVATNHTGVRAWGRGHRGSGHATSALGSWCSPSASTSRRT